MGIWGDLLGCLTPPPSGIQKVIDTGIPTGESTAKLQNL